MKKKEIFIKYHKKRGDPHRSRSLADLNNKFQPNIVEKTVQGYLESGRKVRVLEIGCGNGRVLMELRKLFPHIELHGINKEPYNAIKKAEDFAKTAVFHNIFKPSEVIKVPLPKLHLYDAERLRFEDESFDVIISQMAIPYIRRKNLLLEEVWRVLKTNGRAFLNIDHFANYYPDFLNYKTPRFIIYNKNKIVMLKAIINRLNRNNRDIKYLESGKNTTGHINLIIMKNISKPLKIPVDFDENSSFDLVLAGYFKRKFQDSLWGYRSVFKLT